MSGDIENYTGYQFITGPELTAKFEEHLRKYDIILEENEEVTGLKKVDTSVYIKTNKGAYEARTAIIASGKRLRELGVPGEKEFKNKAHIAEDGSELITSVDTLSGNEIEGIRLEPLLNKEEEKQLKCTKVAPGANPIGHLSNF